MFINNGCVKKVMSGTVLIQDTRQDARYIESMLPTDAARLRRLADLFEKAEDMMVDIRRVSERLGIKI